MPKMPRRLFRLAAVTVVAMGIVALDAAAASAHAVLLETSPTQGQILARPPREIRLRFNEQVEASLGAVRLYDEGGRRLDTGGTTKPSGDVVAVAVRETLPAGAYVVTWRVISADSHPVQGSFSFQVGTSANSTSSQVQALEGSLLGKQTGSRTVGVVYGVVRAVVFAALAVLVGGACFLVAIWPRGRASRRARTIVWVGWWGLALATVASLLLEGVYGAGLGLGSIAKTGLLRDVLATHFGHVLVARLLLLGVGAAVLAAILRRREPEQRVAPALVVTGAALAGGLTLTVSLAGHADTGSFVPFALPADWVHVAAMCIWIGGLVLLGAIVLASDDIDAQGPVVTRFSQVAAGCVVALVATGAYQTWRQVGGWQALRRTDFGQLLSVKLVIFLGLSIVAVRSRDITNALYRRPREEREPALVGAAVGGGGTATLREEPDPELEGEWDDEIDEQRERRILRHGVVFETVLAVIILAVSAMLVNAQPGRSALQTLAFAGGESNVTLKNDQVWVDITLAPGKAGANDVHVNTLVSSGGLTTPLDLKMTLDLPSKGIAPLAVPLIRAGPGHYLASSMLIPLAGRWRVTARVLLDRTDETVLVGTVTVR